MGALLDFLREVPARAMKNVPIDQAPAVRLYSTQHLTAWNLQVFCPLMNGFGGTCPSKTFIVATASMSRADLVAVRDAITAALEEK